MLRPPPPLIWGASCVDFVGSVWKPRLTPGTSAARFANCRPFRGRFSIWASLMTVPMPVSPLSIRGALAGDRQLFGLADRELEVDGRARLDVHDHLAAHRGEAGHVGLDFIVADRQPAEVVLARRVADSGPREAGPEVLRGDRRARNDQALRVHELSFDRSARALQRGQRRLRAAARGPSLRASAIFSSSTCLLEFVTPRG